MPDLRETIDRLVVSFAEDVLAAIKNMSLDEVMGLTGQQRVGAPRAGRATTTPAAVAESEAEAAPVQKSVAPKKKAGRKPKAAKPAAAIVRVDARAEARASEVAERFFEECGKRGATEFQMREAFKAQGLALAGNDVVRTLVEREVIRDAGFKRSTGNGIAPVFVHSSLSQ